MLKHGILGLIGYGDKSGYEIMTVFRDSLKHFWTAQTSQIYRELQTMEKAGWIRQRHVPQSGRPDKNVYSITPAGREELLRWLRDDNLPEGARNPYLLKTFFMGELPVEESVAFFKALRDVPVFLEEETQVSAKAEMYRQAVRQPEKAVFWKLTIEYGRMYEAMQRAWCELCIRELEALQGMKRSQEPGGAAAADEQEE